MENGLAVKTSSEDSGEASKNDTGSSADEMDVDLAEGEAGCGGGAGARKAGWGRAAGRGGTGRAGVGKGPRSIECKTGWHEGTEEETHKGRVQGCRDAPQSGPPVGGARSQGGGVHGVD